MASVYDSLSAWARKTTTTFAVLLATGGHERAHSPAPGEIAYRLRQWPRLPQAVKTAAVLRTLSVMSQRPVNRRWMLANTKLRSNELNRLLASLDQQGALETIDTSRFERRHLDDPVA